MLVPLWTNFVIRVYAWMMLLRTQGAINSVLGWLAGLLGLPFTPLEMLYTPGAVLVGMVYEFLPFMILPIYTSLEKNRTCALRSRRRPGRQRAQNPSGASPCRSRCRAWWLAHHPGLRAGDGTFVVSDLLGGKQVILVGNLIQRQFLDARDPTLARRLRSS